MLLWAFQSCIIIIFIIIIYFRLFQTLEDEALAKVEVFRIYSERQKTEPYRKLLSFSQGSDAELPHT